MGCGSGDPKTFGEFGYGVIVQLVVFEESLSLFAHGDTSPGMAHLLQEESFNHVLGILSKLCPRTVHTHGAESNCAARKRPFLSSGA